MDEPDALEVLRGAARGDRAAARRLIDDAGPIVYGYVYGRVGGDQAVAEDIVQDTFLEAIRSADTFRGDASISTWMCSIARHRLARHYEAERRRTEQPPELTVVQADEPTQVVDERDAVTRALGRLSAVHRQVLVLKYLDGQSVAEIADELGRTRVQVQSLLQRARSALRSELEVAT